MLLLLIHVGMVCHDSYLLKMILTFHHLTCKSLSNLVQDISPCNPNGSCPHIVMFYGIHHFVTGKYALPMVPSCALLLCMTMRRLLKAGRGGRNRERYEKKEQIDAEIQLLA